MTTSSSPQAYLVDELKRLRGELNNLKAQKVTYLTVPVTAASKPSSTFTVQVPNQQDGSTGTLAGIAAPPQFLPTVGTNVTLALTGAQPIYQPAGIAAGAIGATNLNPDAPNPPTGLTLSTSTTTGSDGTVHGKSTASWTAPSTTVAGNPISGALTYTVIYRPTGTSTWSTMPSTTTSASFTATAGVTYDVQVAAIDQLGNISTYASLATITTAVDTTAPAAPTTPVVGNYLGQLQVTWDGNLSGGVAPPTDFDFVEVHVSPTTGFTPSTATLVADLSTGGSAYSDAPYGVTMFAKLIAVDRSNNRSAASPQASGSTSQVVSADILAGAVGTAQLSDLAVSINKLTDGAVGSSKLADLAVTSAKIANLAVGTAQMADLSVATAKIANLAVGTAQIGSLAVNDAKIGSMAAGKITAGTMSADVVVGGRFATALTGARVELNAAGLQKWDSTGTQTVSITGSTNLLTGQFQTATTGQRLVINAGGTNASRIDFYPTTGTTFASIEATTVSGQGAVTMSATNGSPTTSSGVMLVRAGFASMSYGTSNQSTVATEIYVDPGTARTRAQIVDLQANGNASTPGGTRISMGVNYITDCWVNFWGSIYNEPMFSAPNHNCGIVFSSNVPAGAGTRMYITGGGGSSVDLRMDLDCGNVIYSGALSGPSSRAIKKNITTVTDVDIRAASRASRAVRFQKPSRAMPEYRNDRGEIVTPAAPAPIQLGLIAEEVPTAVQLMIPNTPDGDVLGIDYTALMSLTWTGLGEAFNDIADLVTRVAALEQKGKP